MASKELQIIFAIFGTFTKAQLTRDNVVANILSGLQLDRPSPFLRDFKLSYNIDYLLGTMS
jgi:hypothetical protein